jgi:hypothetical protein
LRGYYDIRGTSEWKRLRAQMTRGGVNVPDRPAPSLLDLLYSTKRDHAVGWNYRTMPEIAHRLALEKKGHLRWFIHALRTYDYYRAFKVADCSGK